MTGFNLYVCGVKGATNCVYHSKRLDLFCNCIVLADVVLCPIIQLIWAKILNVTGSEEAREREKKFHKIFRLNRDRSIQSIVVEAFVKNSCCLQYNIQCVFTFLGYVRCFLLDNRVSLIILLDCCRELTLIFITLCDQLKSKF